jgi:outer membrane protein assembly factor BamB
MVQASNRRGGACAVVGREDAELSLALAKQGSFVVQGLYANASTCDLARDFLRSHGSYGVVSAGVFDGGRLPYTDNLVTILVLDDFAALQQRGLTLREVARVLAPLGTAYLRVSTETSLPSDWADELDRLGLERTTPPPVGDWVQLRKPWPAEIDQWTHYLHAADGNPVARDRVVGPPKHYQWISGPMWQRSHETDSSISTLVTAAGRLFYIEDQAPISLVGDHSLPDKWFLVARDAFNGVELWKVPIRRWGWREWKETWFTNRPGDFPLNLQKRLVAVGNHVYVTLGYHAPVSQLDATTGEILQTYAGTERTNEILDVDGTLILSVLTDDGVCVVAVDAASGRQRWSSQHAYRGTTVDYLKWSGGGGRVRPAKLDPSLNTATDGRVVALIDGPDIVALDFATGAQKWRTPFPSDEADLNAGGIRSQGDLWIGTMIVAGGAVIHASPYKLAALAADDGRVLWSQPKKYIGHLWYEWKDVFVIDGLVWTWSDQLEAGEIESGGARQQRALWPPTVNGYDLQTGECKKEVPLGPIFCANHHHRCYRNKATERYILASRRGTEYVDLREGQHSVHNWVRGTCHLGMMPANGLQYAPPHPCACYIDEKLNGMNALAPARADEPEPAPAAERLVQGPAWQSIQNPEAILSDARDWPTFRADALRTGAISTTVPDDAAVMWSVQAGRKVSPPVAADGKVFAALVDEHQVVCLDARDGRRRWQFTAGARIDSPPTWHAGTVLFGSADGCVYCLRADDGALAWRFRAAPQERWIGAMEQLESAWPVHGSVLVQDGTAYFAAGRSSQLDGGIRLVGLDAATGHLRCERSLAGPDYKLGDFEENLGLPMGSLPDILTSDGTTIWMRDLAFDKGLQPVKGPPELRVPGGLLEDSYFKRTPWTSGGQYARLIVRDTSSVYYVRMFDSLRGLDPTVFFTPGRNGYLLFSKNADSRNNAWTQRIPVRIRAMLAAGDRLFVAGPPDVVDPKDPLGAFEGRQGGLLYVVDAATGEHRAEHRLPSPPVFNGAAAARGQLYLATEDGRLTGFGALPDP